MTGRFETHSVDSTVLVELEGGHEIRGTSIHPIWSVDRHDWIPLGDLKPGEQLQGDRGIIRVESVSEAYQSEIVYNLETHGEHVYRIGEDGILVHNGTDDCLKVVTAERARIIAQAEDALSPLAKQFPDAKVGFRGSLARGTKGRQKGGGPFDPTDYDVDAFVVCNKLAAAIAKDRKGFRNLGRLPEYRSLIESTSNKLRSIAGHRDKAVKIRVFSTEELSKFPANEVHLLS